MRAAGDDANLLTPIDDLIAVAADSAIDHLESDELPARPFRLLALQDVAAVKVALVDFHDPPEVGFERRGGLVDVVAVERHLRFQAQRVARAEAARFRAGVDELTHDSRPLGRRDVDLESILTRLAGARNDRRHTINAARREVVVL